MLVQLKVLVLVLLPQPRRPNRRHNGSGSESEQLGLSLEFVIVEAKERSGPVLYAKTWRRRGVCFKLFIAICVAKLAVLNTKHASKHKRLCEATGCSLAALF